MARRDRALQQLRLRHTGLHRFHRALQFLDTRGVSLIPSRFKLNEQVVPTLLKVSSYTISLLVNPNLEVLRYQPVRSVICSRRHALSRLFSFQQPR